MLHYGRGGSTTTTQYGSLLTPANGSCTAQGKLADSIEGAATEQITLDVSFDLNADTTACAVSARSSIDSGG